MQRLLPIVSAVLLAGNAFAQDRAKELIHDAVDENKLFTLSGSTRPEMNAKNDRGAAPDSLRLETMILQLKRAPEHEAALVRFIESLHDRSSPNYHHWLSAKDFGDRYGVAPADRDKVVAWLKQKGFTVAAGHKSGMVIAFSGTAAQVRNALHTEIHMIDVGGKRYFANAGDPALPAALAPIVAGVVSLHNIPDKHLGPAFDPAGSSSRNLVPGDVTRIYDIAPLFAEKIFGTGQTIALVGESNIVTNDWKTFRKNFGVSSGGTVDLKVFHPQGPAGSLPCTDPGTNDTGGEATVDVEWASATAPGANIELATCNSGATAGQFIAFLNLIDADSTPDIISISFEAPEAALGAGGNAAVKSAYQTATALGISVFVASGDQGAATGDAKGGIADHGIAVNGRASTQFNVAVGGTDFRDTFDGTTDTFWNKTNDKVFASAKSYVPEIPWNSSCGSELFATKRGFSSSAGASGWCSASAAAPFRGDLSGGGGPSSCASGAESESGVVSGTCKGHVKPSWQKNVGEPSDGVRDVPDVSLFSANGLWRHSLVFCMTTTDKNNKVHPCTSDPKTWSSAGGTSFASPMMAGIQALVNQHEHGRQGLPTFVYYQLAAKQYGKVYDASCEANLGAGVGASCVFRDVTSGDTAVGCGPASVDENCVIACNKADTICMNGAHNGPARGVCAKELEHCTSQCPVNVAPPNCFLPSGEFGVLSTSQGKLERAFSASKRYDLATGLGSVDAANLVHHWSDVPGAPPPATPPKSNQQCLNGCSLADETCMKDAHNGPARGICAKQLERCNSDCK